MLWLGLGQWRRTLQKVSPPHPRFRCVLTSANSNSYFCPSLNSICVSLLSRMSTRPDSAASRLDWSASTLRTRKTGRERFEPAQQLCLHVAHALGEPLFHCFEIPLQFIVQFIPSAPGGGGFVGESPEPSSASAQGAVYALTSPPRELRSLPRIYGVVALPCSPVPHCGQRQASFRHLLFCRLAAVRAVCFFSGCAL